jgi:hypothetical protein
MKQCRESGGKTPYIPNLGTIGQLYFPAALSAAKDAPFDGRLKGLQRQWGRVPVGSIP